MSRARERYMRWLSATRDLSPHTLRAYGADVGALERHLGATARVADIDRDRLVRFVEELRGRGLSPVSIRRRASGVRGFCGWLVARGELGSDPWLGPTGRRRCSPPR
jgi:integrase/recombinase XerC